jgi:osomolarity two-component system response regulator SKN7
MMDDMMPTQQMDLFNTQLVATQQQLQQLQERYNELSMHHSMLLQELIGVQKTVVNHEHIMQYVMNFLQSVDGQRRRESRVANPFAHQSLVLSTASKPLRRQCPKTSLHHRCSMPQNCSQRQTIYSIRATSNT